MLLHEKQRTVVASNARFKVLNCGRGWGKTHLAIEILLWHAVNTDNARVAYLAPTFDQARDIAWTRLVRRTQDFVTKKNESRLELIVPNKHGTESVIVLKSWEAVETLRGQEFDALVLDEVASMKEFWAGWEEVLRPTLRVSQGPVVFISTPKGFNHWYDLYTYAETQGNWANFHFTSYDNPHLAHEEIDEAKKQMSQDRFAQEYMADFRRQEGLVYKEFIRGLHVFPELAAVPPTIETLTGVDFGFRNPAAIIQIKKDKDGTFWVTGEWYKTEQSNTQLIEAARQFSPHSVYPDPAEPDRIAEMKAAGLNCREVNKDVEKGIDTVRELFKQGRIRVWAGCKNLIAELEQYHYDENRPEKETPVKEYDHAVDALRYALHNHVGLSIIPRPLMQRRPHSFGPIAPRTE